MGTVEDTVLYYATFTNGITDPKLNKPFYLCDGAGNDNTPNLGEIDFVPMGGIDTNVDAQILLNFFYRSTTLSIKRTPYIPDFNLKITSIKKSYIKREYRLLIYAYGAYLKCNVRLNPNDKHTRDEMTKNDAIKWIDKLRYKPEIVNNVFYDNSSAAARKIDVLARHGAGQTIMEYLRKSDNLNSDNQWFVRALDIIAHNCDKGWTIFKRYFNLWKEEEVPQNSFQSRAKNEWMFNLIHYVKANECLCVIKALEIVGSRIVTHINNKAQAITPQDGTFLVKSIKLMLDLVAKGNINGCYEAFMPLFIDSVELCDDIDAQSCLNVVQNTTIIIGETLRVLGNLSDFDFEWLLRNKYVHQCWVTYFNAAFLALLDAIFTFEDNLGNLCEYSSKLSDHSTFGMFVCKCIVSLTFVYLFCFFCCFLGFLWCHVS